MEILQYDREIAVCVKPVGVLSEEPGVPVLLGQQLGGTTYCVHRLDKAVGGVMVYARTQSAAAKLSKAVADRQMEKEYLAVCRGIPQPVEGVMEDLLFKDSGKNKAFVVKRERKGVKQARLTYQVLATADTPEGAASLVRVQLDTGRFHQIRVQFASRQHPLLGDRKYGGPGEGTVALWSHRIAFPHPKTGETVDVTANPPPVYPWTLFGELELSVDELRP